MQLILDSRPAVSYMNALWTDILAKSGMFEVRYEETAEGSVISDIDKRFMPRRRPKHGAISFARINGRKVIFDTQFDIKCTEMSGTNIAKELKPDLWVAPEKSDVLERVGIRMTCWVLFPCSWDLVDKFKWEDNEHITPTLLTTGPHSLRQMNRVPWFDAAPRFGIETNVNEDGGIPTDEYVRKLSKCKWGVILNKGRNKNTREFEFISNHMPLALNYEPLYDFPFNPNEQYLKLNSPDDLGRLTAEDPAKYHEQSKWLWENYWRPDKASQWLLSML